jgi:hypothetical protein
MKTYWEIRGIALCILNLSTRMRSVVSFMLWLLYPQGKEPLITHSMWALELVWTQW